MLTYCRDEQQKPSEHFRKQNSGPYSLGFWEDFRRKVENHNLKRYMHPRVHWSTVYNKWAIKKNETMSFAATWTDLEMITLSEVRQRKMNITWHHFYAESKKKKKWCNWTYLQTRNRVTGFRNKVLVTKGERWDKLGFWDLPIHTIIHKTDNQQGPSV